MSILRRGISISIVTFNTWERTAECISSLLEHCRGSEFEILVHDNGISQVSAPFNSTRVQLMSSPTNVGFGAGHNANLCRAQFDTFLILNPDVTLTDAVILALRDAVQVPEVSAASPILVFPDGTEQLSFRKFPNVYTEMARVVGRDHRPDSKWSTLVRVQPDTGLVDVDQPAGAALAVRTQLLRNLRGFDESYLMYFEDVDLCTRLSANGRIVALSDVHIFHDGEGTAKSYRTATTFWIEYSRRNYHSKNASGAMRIFLLALCALSCATHLVVCGLQSAVGSLSNRLESSTKARGYAYALLSLLWRKESTWKRKFLTQ